MCVGNFTNKYHSTCTSISYYTNVLYICLTRTLAVHTYYYSTTLYKI